MSSDRSSSSQIIALFFALTVAMSSIFGGVALADHGAGSGIISAGNVSTESGTADDIVVNITSQDGSVTYKTNLSEGEGFSKSLNSNHTYEVTFSEPIHLNETETIELDDGDDIDLGDIDLASNGKSEINGELETQGDEDFVFLQVNDSTGSEVARGQYEVGNYSIVVDGDNGPYEMTASATNHTREQVTFSLNSEERTTQDFVLDEEQDGTVEGTITLNNENGQNATAELVDNGAVAESQTDISSGDSYSLSDPPGEYTLRVSAPDYENFTTTVQLTDGGTISNDITLNLEDPTISGTISTERSDYSNDVNITVKDSGGTIVTSEDFEANGDYNVSVPSTGTYEVIANSSNHSLESQDVTINDATDDLEDVDFDLEASDRGTYELEVDSVDGNATSIDVVALETGDVQTISDGGKATFDLPTGEYELEASASGYEVQTTNVTVEEYFIKSSSLTLQLADGNVEGSVFDDFSPSSQDFTVSVQGTSNSTTVQNGNTFSFQLDPGEYTVQATATDYITATNNVTITPEGTQSIVLSPYKPKNISVNLTMENSTIAPNGTVTVSETGNDYTIDNNETFNITGLSQGTYTLESSADGHITQTTEIEVDSDGAERNITLAEDTGPTGFLGITVTSDDESASNIEISINETGQTFYADDNETVQVELPDGNYTVEANAAGYNQTATDVSVVSDSTTATSLTLNSSLPSVNVPGVRIVTDNSYWVGQDFWRENLSNYSEVRWENQVTTVTLDRSINSSTNVYNDSVENITSQIGPNSDYILYGVDSSGNKTQIASVFLGIQTLNASFNPNTTSETAEIALNSNRDNGYEVIVSQESSDTNTLDKTELKELFGQNATTEIREINGTDEVVMEVPSGGFTTQMNVSELERADYNFDFNVVDTPTQAEAHVTLVVPEFEGEPDAVVEENGRYWLGQELEVEDNIEDGETISIYRNDTTFVQELTADEFGVVQIRTEQIDVGDYHIEDSDDNRIINFSVKEQTVTANFTDDNVTNGGTLSESGLTIDSNRATYDLLIEANYSNSTMNGEERVDPSTLASALGLNTTSENETSYALATNLSNPETLIVDFENLSAGEYRFNVTPEDATGNASTNITVKVPVEGQADFEKQFYTNSRGDIADIGVTFGGDAENVTLNIGRFNEVGYTLSARITKSSQITDADLEFDTSKAGQGNPTEVLQSDDSNVDIEILSETTLPGNRTLANARYLMEMKVDNQTTDISTLNLFDVGVESGAFYGTPPTVSSVGSESVIVNRSVNMNEIGNESYVTLGFNVTGLETQLDSSGRTASDFQPNSSFANASGISVDIEKDNAGLNADPQSVNMGEALAYHYVTPEERADALNTDVGNNTTAEDEVGNHTMVYFVFDGSTFNTSGDGTYHAEMNVTEENAFVNNNNINFTANFTLVESETNFDRHWSDDLLVLPESNQTLSGTTTLPPGTELTHEIRSENVRFPYYESKDVEVTENQTFNATYDLSNFPVGLEFNTSIPSQMENKSIEVVSEIQPAPPQDMSNVTIFTQVDEQSTPATVELGDRTIDTSGEPARSTVYVQKGTYQLTGTMEQGDTNVTIDETVTIDSNDEPIIANFNNNSGNVTYADPRDLPDDYQLNVSVNNESGSPVAGIVSVGGQSKVATGGTATFQLEEGSYSVEANAHQHESGQTQVELDSNETISITLESRQVELPEPANNSSSGTPTSETPGQPGFGVVISLLALLGAAFVVKRKQ